MALKLFSTQLRVHKDILYIFVESQKNKMAAYNPLSE